MFGKTAYNYNNYNGYPDSPGLNSVSSTSSSCSASTLSSLVSLHDINQELNQTVFNSVYNQMNPNSNSENSYNPTAHATKNFSPQYPSGNTNMPVNSSMTDTNSNLALSHAIGKSSFFFHIWSWIIENDLLWSFWTFYICHLILLVELRMNNVSR